VAITIETTFYSSDPQIAGMLKWLNGISQWDSVRHECEAHIFVALARSAWREADRLRGLERKREIRDQRKKL